MTLSPTAAILIAFIIVTAALAAGSLLADRWLRRNIPLPEDFPDGEDGEAAMIAEFERLRNIHAAQRRQAKDAAQ